MKKCMFILVFILVFPLFFFGCASPSVDECSSYDIKINYNHIEQKAECSEKVEYFNSSDDELEFLYFHLYPNAFRENAKREIVAPAYVSKAYPNGKSYGSIEIKEVKNAEYALNFEIIGEDENILKIDLLNNLKPNEKIKIIIDFSLIIPNIKHRFGYGENTVNFGNFYPIACVYENSEFKTDLYSSNGDPFYSECSQYNVEITYDESFILASTGEQLNTSIENSRKTTFIKARNVRDFCFILSSKFKVLEQKTGNTVVKYYYYKDQNPEDSLNIAIKSIETFNSTFGTYPYSQYSVVESDFVYGGMEYPNLVLISDDLQTQSDYEYVIIHETAHQWWYGLVGNNEYENAWIDEGLAEFSTALFYDKNSEYGVNYKNIIKGAEANYQIFLDVYNHIFGKIDTSMNRRLDEFNTEPEYVNCTYVKGLLLFNELRENLGEKIVERVLREIIDKKKYKNISYDEFISYFEKYAGEKSGDIIRSYVN